LPGCPRESVFSCPYLAECRGIYGLELALHNVPHQLLIVPEDWDLSLARRVCPVPMIGSPADPEASANESRQRPCGAPDQRDSAVLSISARDDSGSSDAPESISNAILCR